MRNKEIIRLMAGFRRFKEKYFASENSVYAKLATGQTPKTLIIACSDSRVDPAIISSASPGELFVIRNVANLVPPYETGGQFHGTSSAIEFAVTGLKVENILVIGHRQCGGIRALMNQESGASGQFIGPWMSIATKAKEKVLSQYAQLPGTDAESLCRHCEMESILVSLENLKTFPFVADALARGSLQLHGAYFDLENGQMFEFDQEQQTFRLLDI